MKELIIDAGHGGNDPGAEAFGYKEKDIVLILAKRVQELLKEYDPDMTRTDDKTLNPIPRANLVKSKYRYCLSLHLNAYNGLAGGIETIHALSSKDGKELATILANKLRDATGLRIRRVFDRASSSGGNYYYMHRDTGSTTTIIVESLFLDNKKDVKQLNIESIAQAIAQGFKEFKAREEKEVSNMLTYHRLLKLRSRGADVTDLQRALTGLGYDTNGIDSIFGNGTDRATRLFQGDNGLTIDGLVGRGTIAALNESLKKKTDLDKRYEVIKPDSKTTIVKIKHSSIRNIDLIVANTITNREKLSSMRNREKVDLIISGGLWWNDREGKSHSLNLLLNKYKQLTAGVYSRYGLMTYRDGSYKFDWYKWDEDLKDMLGGSPSLVINNQVNIDTGKMKGSILTSRHPRAGIGMNDEYIFLVTIDGRQRGKRGATVEEFAKLMLSIGCTDAIGGDGGGTVRMENRHGALNSPTEDRYSNNAIGIKLK